jgi:hypothetical protein
MAKFDKPIKSVNFNRKNMKHFKIIALVTLTALLSSCGSTMLFPLSEVTPAAEITAKKKKEMSSNYTLTLTAENLASPERLKPPKKYYVIWVVSETGGVRNAGHFKHKNAETATYKASFPYHPVEVFITAEEEDALCKPSGIEISRLKLE